MKKKILQEKVKIIANRQVSKNYFKLTFAFAKLAALAAPGQFVSIKVSDGLEPLLRRPFSIHKVSKSQVEILYEVLGEGTKILSQRKSGELLDVIGPLGNGFGYGVVNCQLQILVAGGMGIAPLVFLSEKLDEIKNKNLKTRTLALIGGRTKEHILCEKEFKNYGCSVKISTDDGSLGFRGRVTELLANILLTTYNLQVTTIYACGPKPMLKEVARIAEKFGVAAQISLEEHMACGIGACLGCVVNTQDGYKRVCKDGPVFKSQEIIWDKVKGAGK